MSSTSPPPQSLPLSIVVIVYAMGREAPRTLRSLALPYQRGIAAEDYEVLVVENGSPEPLDAAAVEALGPGFSYHRLPPGDPSPVAALNHGLSLARGEMVGILIDGARLVTPGLLAHALLALRLAEHPIVAVPGFHLGSELQGQALPKGYGPEAEDALLASIGWPADGYRLFEISVFAGSSKEGWFRPMAESNALFLPRDRVAELGGYDLRFRSPGGGLANLDFYRRACALPDARLVVLLGEGTFHQVHGGVTTRSPEEGAPSHWERLHGEYMEIKGEPFVLPQLEPLYLGSLPPAVLPKIEWSCRFARERPG